ncbi:MAG: hypothetical protein K2X27_08620 [Candidatus Obscuribacterales bacterium]|nr:hypothetical protein [Candidatus Obscuribacterales bacterium]
MIKHIRTKLTAAAEVAPSQPQVAEMPNFTFAAVMGRKSIDEISTDLVLVPVLCGMNVPRDLHTKSSGVGDFIKAAIKDSGFEGKRGEKLLLDTELPGSTASSSRHVLVSGLGRHDQFCAGTAFDVFVQCIEEAIRLNAVRVTIPFAPNRGTGSCLNMKGMGHKLKAAVAHCFSRLDAPVSLKEVQIYCTAQAKSFIQQGLAIPVGEGAHNCGGCED